MKKIVFCLFTAAILLVVLSADEFFIYQTRPLASAKIGEKYYLALPDGLYKKSGEHYELIYKFAQNQRQAFFQDNVIYLAKTKLIITPLAVRSFKNTNPAATPRQTAQPLCSIKVKAVPFEQFQELSAQELAYHRYEIAARRGKIFKNQEIHKFFSAQSWYKPDPNYSDTLLTASERALIKKLYALEEQKRRSALKDKPRIKLPGE